MYHKREPFAIIFAIIRIFEGEEKSFFSIIEKWETEEKKEGEGKIFPKKKFFCKKQFTEKKKCGIIIQ